MTFGALAAELWRSCWLGSVEEWTYQVTREQAEHSGSILVTVCERVVLERSDVEHTVCASLMMPVSSAVGAAA